VRTSVHLLLATLVLQGCVCTCVVHEGRACTERGGAAAPDARRRQCADAGITAQVVDDAGVE